MKRPIAKARLMEILEDRFEAATGQPREVTGFDLDIVPEQSKHTGIDWSPEFDCDEEFRPFWRDICKAAQAEYPRVSFE